MKDFKNKVALITGAGSGIGRALALQLAEEGCNLALVDWNNETLEETKHLLSKKNISISTHNFDLREKDKINELPDKIVELHNNIDIVFNNAGLSVVGTVDEVDEDDWNFGMDILLNSVIQMSTVFLPHLKKRPVSAIVNTSSIFGLFSVPKQSIYNVGKFGVKAFTESLAIEMEMAESPVEVYCVFPGHIGTNIYHASKFKSFEADDAGAAIFGANASTIEEAADQFKNNAPLTPGDAAKIILDKFPHSFVVFFINSAEFDSRKNLYGLYKYPLN